MAKRPMSIGGTVGFGAFSCVIGVAMLLLVPDDLRSRRGFSPDVLGVVMVVCGLVLVIVALRERAARGRGRTPR